MTEAENNQAKPAKKASESLTVRAAIAAAALPLIAGLLAAQLGLAQEQAQMVAQAVFAGCASLVAYGLRRAGGEPLADTGGEG
jgi:predicted branched-subunit amino acid permease